MKQENHEQEKIEELKEYYLKKKKRRVQIAAEQRKNLGNQKLNKEDFELYKDLNKRTEDHKAQVIMYALLRDSKMYDSELLNRYKNMELKPLEEEISEGEDFTPTQVRAYRTEEDLRNRKYNGEPEIYDKVYEYCWDTVKDVFTMDGF